MPLAVWTMNNGLRWREERRFTTIKDMEEQFVLGNGYYSDCCVIALTSIESCLFSCADKLEDWQILEGLKGWLHQMICLISGSIWVADIHEDIVTTQILFNNRSFRVPVELTDIECCDDALSGNITLQELFEWRYKSYFQQLQQKTISNIIRRHSV